MHTAGWLIGGILGGGMYVILSLQQRRGRLTSSDGTGAIKFGSALLVFGLIVGIWAHFAGREAAATLQWPHVAGTIIHSELQEYPDLGPSAKIQYRYTVDGKEYTGDQVTPRNTAWNKDHEIWVTKYPIGARVEVRYDPGNPARAVLESGMAANYNAMSMAIGTWIFALSLVIFGLRSRHTLPLAFSHRGARG